MRNSKNILFIIPEMSMGGAQRSVAKISNALRSHHNVWIVVFNKHHAPAKAYQGDLLSLDVESGNRFFIKAKAFITRIIRLRALKKRLNIDVSISFLEGADYINILSAIGDKIVLSIRGSKVHDENMHGAGFKWRKLLIQYLYQRADVIVCVNNGIADEMREYYSITNTIIRTIYNFYDIKDIQHLANLELPHKVRYLYDSPTIVMSGRLAPEKGHDFVVKLFAELKKQKEKVRLILVGDGPLREPIIQLAKSRGLSVAYRETELYQQENPDIYITGDQENVFNYLKNATIYILNSSSEGFPNGLAEAMICGLPVMAADCPYGPREILSRVSQVKDLRSAEYADYGILLPVPGNKPSKIIFSSWLSAILKQLDSDKLRNEYASRGLKRMQDFTSDKLVEKWQDIVEV